jgi:predicted nucleic acid-binding Zn ribbon protein
MPKYLYKCEECEEEFYATHLMSETCEECPECNETGCVSKKVSSFRTFTKKNDLKKSNNGDIVKRSIEEIRTEVKGERDRLKKVTYN